MIVLRNIAGVKATNELQVFTCRETSTSGGTITIETHCTNILFEIGKLIDATATLVATVANSTTYPGTKSVAYSVASGKTLEALIIATNGYTDAATVTTNGTLDATDIP